MKNTHLIELYKKHYQTSFKFVKSYVRDDLVSEDIVAETLIELWQLMKKEDVKSPLSLLVIMLRNKSLNHLKHMSVREGAMQKLSMAMQADLSYRIATLQACEPEELFSTEINDIINKTLDSLPEQTRLVFQMSRYENLSVKEIADKLDISNKGVEYHITKSLKQLRISLHEYLTILPFLMFL